MIRPFLICLLALPAFAQVGLRSPAFVSQLQRTSGAAPFAPGDYGTVLVWYKADALSLSDNDPVVTWTDSGPNSFHATNLTAGASRPVYKANIVNSKPTVRFDGADWLFWGAASGNAGSVFVVVGNVTYTSANAVIGPDGGVQRLITFINNATTIYGGDAAELFTTAFTTRVDGVATSTFPASPAFGQITQKPTAPADMQSFFIGLALNDDWNGDIAEILIYTTALGDTERDAVESYLATKYGL